MSFAEVHLVLFRIGPRIVHELNEIMVDAPKLVFCDGQRLLLVVVRIADDHGRAEHAQERHVLLLASREVGDQIRHAALKHGSDGQAEHNVEVQKLVDELQAYCR